MSDFVSYELAVKLKEKGFDKPCIYAYCEKGGWNKYTQKHEPITHIKRTDGNPFGSFYVGNNWNKEYKTNKNKIQCSAPTISQVLKWLRKEKKIHITVLVITESYKDADNNICEELSFWSFSITSLIDGSTVYDDFEEIDCIVHLSYEQAALAGIEYVLDNLI
jgi:hypothetical protein